jgi:tetratricopeptide (TPR) repeat protein
MLQSDHPTDYGATPLAEAQAEALPFARRAVQLDPNLGDGYAALGFLSTDLGARSEPYLRKAVELSPQRPEFHRWHAQTLMNTGRYADAIEEYRRAVEIDPLWSLSYDHLIGALYLVGRKDEAKQAARRFLSLSTDQRARLLLTASIQKLDYDLAGQLRTTRLLQKNYPDERTNRLNLAAVLAELGERRAAAELVAYDPVATAALTGDWKALARDVRALGPAFWDRGGFWNAPGLLVASGQSDSLANLYYRDLPLVRSGLIDIDDVARPEVIVALRRSGHVADANRLLAQYRQHLNHLPDVGLFAEEKRAGAAAIAEMTGDRETAIRRLDQSTRETPYYYAIPAMALRYDPVFGSLSTDSRFPAIEDRIRGSVNRERQKAGLPPISREAWISDPKTLLTKN